MNKYHSFQLPKVAVESSAEAALELASEQLAEQSLFQISKFQDSSHIDNHFWRQLSKLHAKSTRYEKSMSLPKKRSVEIMPVIDVKTFRSPSTNNCQQTLNVTSYVVLDDGKGQRGQKKPFRLDQSLLHAHINRKAKYLFRSKQKSKLPEVFPKNSNGLFSQSFYCSKISPPQYY